MIVKVCGVRDAAVAECAVAAGADWVGVVLEPRSVRHADASAIAEVRAVLAGRAALVGVMVSPSADECAAAVARHGLDAVQVHGEVERGLAAALDVPVICARNHRSPQAAYTDDWWPDGLLLVDAPAADGALPGGTGEPMPLDWAVQLARHRRIVLAGGLRPDTVGAAIDRVRPWGVDASSGLEVAPGHKDPALVRAYVEAARAAFVAVHPATTGALPTRAGETSV